MTDTKRPELIAFRLSDDYVNKSRDKRHSTGFHSMPKIKAGTFGVYRPMWQNGDFGVIGAACTLFTNTDTLSIVSVPYDYLEDFNPDKPRTIAQRTEPATPGEVLALADWAHYNTGHILRALFDAGAITLGQVRQAVDHVHAKWDAEEG